MVLETFTGLLVYTNTRTDYMLVCTGSETVPHVTIIFSYVQNQHLDDHVKEISMFSFVADKAGGELAPYLLNMFFKTVSLTRLKHSKHPSSREVSHLYIF